MIGWLENFLRKSSMETLSTAFRFLLDPGYRIGSRNTQKSGYVKITFNNSTRTIGEQQLIVSVLTKGLEDLTRSATQSCIDQFPSYLRAMKMLTSLP